MFQIFWEEPIITAAMVGFWAVSLLVRILLGMLYRGMIRQSDNMATTNNRLLRQCKLKFANCYQLNNGVSNIPVFVDKFLNRLTLGPISFETLYHLSGQSMLLAIIFAGAGICSAIMRGHTVGEILPFYIVSCMGLYFYFSVSSMVNLKGKKRTLKVNLVDYLENHLSARIGVTENDLKMLYGSGIQDIRNMSDVKEISRRERTSAKRRTLELMPIGSRSAAGAEFMTGGAVTAESAIHTSFPAQAPATPGEVAPFAAVQGDGTGSVAAEPPIMAVFSAKEPPRTDALSMQQSQPMPQSQSIAQPQSVPQPAAQAAPGQVNPFYISEEELEALIKEFC